MINLRSPRLIARWCQMEYGFKQLSKEQMKARVISRAENILSFKFNEPFEVYHSTIDTPQYQHSQFQALTIYFPLQQQAVVIYRGTETINDWYYNYTGIFAGVNIEKIQEALEYFYFIKNLLPNDTEYIGAGHSLGGHLISNVQLLTSAFMRVYTFNTATLQLYQLKQLDKKFNQQLQSYFYSSDKMRGAIEKIARYYYQQQSQVIFNYKRENDFIHFFYNIPGAFLPGTTVDLPPLLSHIVDPYDFMTLSDVLKLTDSLSELYNYLLTKDINTKNIHSKVTHLSTYIQYFLFNKLIKPLHINQWLTPKQKWIRIGGTPHQHLKKQNIDEAYQLFKAMYHYIIFLVHTGLIPETMVKSIPQQEINDKFKQQATLDQLIKPLLSFIYVIKAIKSYLEHKKGRTMDLTGWEQLAKLHYLDYMYDVLPLDTE